MSGQTPPAVSAFRRLFEHGCGAMPDDLIAEGVTLRPPTYGKEWRGRPLVAKLLAFAADALGGLRYSQEWVEGDVFVLRFEGVVGGHAISGVDIVTLDSAGRMESIEIFARPPKAVLALRDEMGRRVAEDPEVSAVMGL